MAVAIASRAGLLPTHGSCLTRTASREDVDSTANRRFSARTEFSLARSRGSTEPPWGRPLRSEGDARPVRPGRLPAAIDALIATPQASARFTSRGSGSGRAHPTSSPPHRTGSSARADAALQFPAPRLIRSCEVLSEQPTCHRERRGIGADPRPGKLAYRHHLGSSSSPIEKGPAREGEAPP